MLKNQNFYKDGIDFSTLATEDADFAQFFNGHNGQLDFSDPEAVQQLTKSLLKKDFGLQILLPPDRLCPPVPNRLNYIIWIQGLLDTTASNSSLLGIDDSNQSTIGIDIGTGASCIYPMLGCVQRCDWRFIGTEIDEKSLRYARQNIELNGLEGRIQLLKTEAHDPLLPLDALLLDRVKFSMCNPPFYESKIDMLRSAELKKRPPFTACTGAENEMITAGGEVAFISRMIDESLMLGSRVKWYTSMIGKFSNLAIIQGKIREAGIKNYALTEFIQGNRTRRWAIGWSFDDVRPNMNLARGLSNVAKSLMPFPSEYLFTFAMGLHELGQRVDQTLCQLPITWRWNVQSLKGVGYSERDVWSRAARRQIVRAVEGVAGQGDGQMTSEGMGQRERWLGFGFEIRIEGISECTTRKNQMLIRWIQGFDSVLFESFCGMMKRRCLQ